MASPFPALSEFREPLPFPIHWVSDAESAAPLQERLRARVDPWGIDIETTLTGQHHCEIALVQISDGKEAWLVDSMAFDFKGVIEALYASREHFVVVHGGIGDLAVLKRVLGIVPDVVFDTLVAAQALAHPSPNLRELARDCLSVTMTKGSQQSNWLTRPLSPGQFKYGALDAWVLPGIARVMAGRVAAADRNAAMKEGLKGMLDGVKAYQAPKVHPFEWGFAQRHRDKGARARLHALLDWRTEQANKGHIALLMSVGNRMLASIAERHPLDDAGLIAAGFPRGLVRRYGQKLLGVLKTVEETGEKAVTSD